MEFNWSNARNQSKRIGDVEHGGQICLSWGEGTVIDT